MQVPEEAAAMQATQTVTLSIQQEPKRKDDQKGSEDASQLVRALGFFVIQAGENHWLQLQWQLLNEKNRSVMNRAALKDIERGIWHASSNENRLSRKSERYERFDHSVVANRHGGMTALKQLPLMVLFGTCLLILSSAEEQQAEKVETQMAKMEEVSIHESKWGEQSSID